MSLTKRQEQQLNRLARLRSDSELVLFEEVQDARDEVEEAKEKVEEVRTEANQIVGELRDFVENHLVGPQGKPGEPGKPGKTGEPGKTPKKGVDYFTRKEIESMILEATPIKGVHYDDGEPGRNPLTVSKKPPKNPQKGDLWYRED